MFDLFRSREKSVRILLGALLLLVALSMLTYLIPNYNTGASANDTVVAEVGKEPLTLYEVQRVIQSSVRGRSVPPEMMPHMVPQIIDQMITERALEYEARRLGFRVSEADTANAIRTMLPSMFQDGKFVGKDTYASVLAQQNLTIPEFEEDIARQVLISRLKNLVLEGVVVTPAEIEREFRYRNAKAKIEYVKISPDKYRNEAQVTPAEMREFYDKNKATFVIPEKRSLDMIVIDQAKIQQSITPTDADLRRAYDSNRERYRTPERVKVRHILLTTTGKPKEEEEAIRKKAEDLLKQVKAGGNFAELAKKNSQDPGSAAKGGELDWVTRGQTVPEFEKAAFSLKPGETSDLVKTAYGYHILQVEAKENAHLRSFDEVKAELLDEVRKQSVNQRVQELADRAQAELKKDPNHPDQVAAKLGLPLVHAEKVSAGEAVPEIGVNREFDEAAAGLRKGDVSQPMLIGGAKFVVAVVRDVFPSHPSTFEEAESQIRQRLQQTKLEQVATRHANELAEKARALKGDLRQAAKSLGLEVVTSEEFSRNGAVTGLGSASFVLDAFSKPAGSIIGPIGVADGKVVAKVLSQVQPEMGQLAAQRDSIREELKNKKGRERAMLFDDGIRQRLIQEGKIRIHQDVVNRVTQSYRG